MSLVFPSFCDPQRVGEINIDAYREKVKRMFYHAYEGYLNHAYPFDELKPLSCTGHDTWGSYSLTLIDAMDTLAVMGNFSEFRRIADILIDNGEDFFDNEINVSVFETNIRIVGGLLSAHLLMDRAGMVLEPGWPCSGPLLRMAESITRKILPAFDTPTGMPYGTVNLLHGVPDGETTVTCTAGVGTFLIEFGTLSRLTGDPIFEKTAVRAIRALWKYRSNLGLLGNHIDVSTGKWTALDSGIGGGIDSYFEYLIKGAIMFNMPELVHMFREYEVSIDRYLKRDDWYMWAQMNKGSITLPMFTSLDGYWPSIKGMLGELDEAMKTLHNFHQVWRQFGFTPEYYNIPKAEVHQGREGYPLRPEIVESAMYLYRATKDPYLLEIGVDIIEAIEHSARTNCGYATVKDVQDHRLEDRMESFFLAETTKYLYLLFDPDNFVHNNGSHGKLIDTPGGQCIIEAGGYVFNTEAHPIDLAAVHCCSAAKKEEDRILQEFHDNLDLLSLLNLSGEDSDTDWMDTNEQFRHKKRSKQKKSKGDYQEEDAETKEFLMKPDEDNELVNSMAQVEQKVGKETTLTREELDRGVQAPGGRDVRRKEEQLRQVRDSLSSLSFTEMERNLTRIFLEEFQMNVIMKNISEQIAQRMEQEFKETEYEHIAKGIAKKILDASTEKSAEDDEKSDESGKKYESLDKIIEEIEKNRHQDISEEMDEPVAQASSSSEGKEIHEDNAEPPRVDSAHAEKTESNTLVVQLSKESTPSSEDSVQPKKTEEQIEQTKPIEKEDDIEKTDTSPPNPALEKFRNYLESQLQFHSFEKSTEEEPAQKSTTSLQIKRHNILSITTKLLKMISGISDDDGKSSKTMKHIPSIAGLYAALSNYSMQYFQDPLVMHCPAQLFHSRLSVYGEMFPEH